MKYRKRLCQLFSVQKIHISEIQTTKETLDDLTTEDVVGRTKTIHDAYSLGPIVQDIYTLIK